MISDKRVPSAQCVECRDGDVLSRGLCGKCYKRMSRSNELSLFPTQNYLDDPESHVRWSFGYHSELVADVAVEYGYKLVKLDGE